MGWCWDPFVCLCVSFVASSLKFYVTNGEHSAANNFHHL
jgi:hypothetical protein